MIKAFQEKILTTLNQVSLRDLVFVVAITLLFTLAYAQSPLYSSNQNQYFLHGLAQAGVGYLDQDWLANTLDPTPIFSRLVAVTYQIVAWPPIFYGYYTVLAGIYIFSLAGIVTHIFPHDLSPAKRWLFFSTLILLHSAAVGFVAVRLIGVRWAFIFDGGVAGQRLLGNVLQPSAFGVLLLLSIYQFLRQRYVWAILLVVITPTIHPTYLLSAATLTAIYMGITFFEKKNFRLTVALGGGALIGVLPILIHSLSTFGGSKRWLVKATRKILVDFRIPHHAIPAEWLDGSVVFKAVLVLGGLYLARRTRLFHFLVWPLVVIVLGTSAQIILDSDVLALLFPWRLSTWVVPLAVGTLTWHLTQKLWGWLHPRISANIILTSSIILTIILAGLGLAKTRYEYRTRAASADRPMMAFIYENKSPEDNYLIPLDMQDFRLITTAPAYVEFKSIPYLDKEVLEWMRRVRVTGNFYRAPQKVDGCILADQFFAEGVTHVVMPYDHVAVPCENLERVFRSIDQYEVYRIIDN